MLRTWSSAMLLAGCIVFAVGVYYEMIKAGIPYQDPPPALQIQYAVNMGIGEQDRFFYDSGRSGFSSGGLAAYKKQIKALLSNNRSRA